METRLQIPKNWQDFEMLCHRLWSDIWSDPNAKRNGRQGQAQNGVDIFGKPLYQATYAGVQCKDKDGRLGSDLTTGELDTECAKAVSFTPSLSSYSLATTAPRDQKLLGHARSLTDGAVFPFEVNVWAWEDIEEEIRFRPKLVESLYPSFDYTADGELTARMSPFTHKEQFHAFFGRPQMRQRIPTSLRQLLLPLAYELSDNAYRHGRASQFVISCTEDGVYFEDNGIGFNPLLGLDATKASEHSHIGSFVFESFKEGFGSEATMGYERILRGKIEVNSFKIQFSKATATLGTFETIEVPIEMSVLMGRNSAEQLASTISIPSRTCEVILVFGEIYNVSAFVEFVRCVLRRLGPENKLKLSMPRSHLLRMIKVWFKDERLTVEMR